MEGFALYLLKSVIWLTGFSLVYILFLRNERFFLLNRFYLLTGIMASMFFPFISIHYIVVIPVNGNINSLDIPLTGLLDSGSSAIIYLIYSFGFIYISGVLFIASKFFRQSLTIIKVIKKTEATALHSAKLIRTADYATSFSFFSYVFVNPSVTDIESEEIVNHELAHISQKHWVDLMLVELLCLFQWFNPVVWIYIRFIRQNHEYLADQVALQRSANPAIYKAALLNQIVGAPVIILANSFNYSINKKRFTMMKNNISSPYRKLKILMILPLIAFLLFAFARPDYKYVFIDEASSDVKFQQTVKEQPTEPVVPQETRRKVKKAKAVSEVPPPPPPPPPVPGISDEVVAAPPPPPPVSGSGFSLRSDDGSKPLVLVNNIETDMDHKSIDPDAIQSIDVLKDDPSSTALYGDKAKAGVVKITLKPGIGANESVTPKVGNDNKIEVIGYGNSSEKTSGIKVRNSGVSLSKAMVIIDGEIYEKSLDEIDPDIIESITVLKGASAIKKYGEKGKDGVIIITSKYK